MWCCVVVEVMLYVWVDEGLVGDVMGFQCLFISRLVGVDVFVFVGVVDQQWGFDFWYVGGWWLDVVEGYGGGQFGYLGGQVVGDVVVLVEVDYVNVVVVYGYVQQVVCYGQYVGVGFGGVEVVEQFVGFVFVVGVVVQWCQCVWCDGEEVVQGEVVGDVFDVWVQFVVFVYDYYYWQFVCGVFGLGEVGLDVVVVGGGIDLCLVD